MEIVACSLICFVVCLFVLVLSQQIQLRNTSFVCDSHSLKSFALGLRTKYCFQVYPMFPSMECLQLYHGN